MRPLYLLIIVVLALLLRLGAISRWPADLTVDRDVYLGIAQSLYDGRGFANPGQTDPTAFRPPLYPVLLASCLALGTAPSVALINLLSTVLLLLMTWRVSRQVGLRDLTWLPALLLAVDPLLIKYSTQPMTEVTSAALMISWVSCWLSWRDTSDWRWAISTGILFGLNVLCRPTLLAAVPLLGIWAIISFTRQQDARHLRLDIAATLSTVITLLPWTARNFIELEKFTPATTHGGYTLLLANNDSFYRSSVETPNWGQTWERLPEDHPDAQPAWYQRVSDEMTARKLTTEVSRDQFQYELAIKTILANPVTFLKACLLRFGWFWHVMPQGPEAGMISRWILIPMAIFYLAENLLAAVGLTRSLTSSRPLLRSRQTSLALMLPVVTLMGVHLFYWTNMRMRASILPIVVIFTVAGVLAVFPARSRTSTAGK